MAKATFHNIHEALAYCGEDYRIERGPALKEEVASPELLSNDRTAAHYFQPRPMNGPDGKPLMSKKSGKPILQHSLDATGQPIEMGKPFKFLDHFAPVEQHPWYVYERQPREVFVNDPLTGRVVHDEDEPVTTVNEQNFEEVAVFPTRQEAEEFVAQQVEKAGNGDKPKKAMRPIPIRLGPDDQNK